MTTGLLAVVQFPHPGREHDPPRVGVMPWNRDSHRRKFLRTEGWYVDASGAQCSTRLVFWGEWEAPSLVVERWTGSGDLPRWLHEPRWERPGWAGPRQNTDPWVFGDEFRYSNCRQGSNAKLRRLAQGSVILFGSSLGGAFVLDTVLVVADARPFVPGLARDLVGDDAYQVCVI